MKIGFFISCIEALNSGKGGHYHSLEAYNKTLNDSSIETFVFNIGNKDIKILRDNIKNYHFIETGINLFKAIEKVEILILEHGIDILHFFDKPSSFFALYIGRKHQLNVISTKCGGPISKFWYPLTGSIIVFTKEDEKYFNRESKFKSSSILLIPNRVYPFSLNFDRIKLIGNKINLQEDAKIFLRICRISEQNKKSIIGTIELVEDLNKRSLKSIYIIIGLIENRRIFEYIQNKYNQKNGYFFTDSIYTENSKEFIPIADFVVGSGRSLMEAAFFGKPILFPTTNNKYPVLLSSSNFDIAFERNFSSRVILNKSDELVFEEIQNLFFDHRAFKEFQILTHTYFDKHFNIKNITGLLIKVYSNTRIVRKIRDLVISYFLFLFYRFIYKFLVK